jgi:gamma-glutamyl:cysteine ligase YbdK (ATP-grasp superfamily)
LSQTTQPLRARLSRLLEVLEPDARALGCAHWLEQLRNAFIPGHGDAEWLRARRTALGNLNDVVREAGQRWLDGPENGN